MVSFDTNICNSAKVVDHGSGTSKYYTVSTCGHLQVHVCTCMEVIIKSRWKNVGRNVTLKKTCLVQAAAVVVHELFHREEKKHSEVVGETN